MEVLNIMKKNQLLKFCFSFIFFLLLIISGCQKQEVQKLDDTNYIVDIQMILILCEEVEAGSEYSDALKGLKGNGDEVLASVKQLEGLEQSVAVKNAIGVGKNILRKTEEAESYFLDALQETTNPTDKAILLSNLAETKYYQKEYVKQYDNALSVMNEAVEEYEKVNTDKILSMVLESNQIRLNMMVDYPKPMVKYVSRLKKLLKEERKQFGSNQFIGMFNFQSIGIACHYDGESIERTLDYMEKSIALNHKLYQYVFFDINMYNIIAATYYREPYSSEKELEYRNKCIELLDQWQSKWHYGRLQAYAKRGEFYYLMGELEKSSEDYNIVLAQSTDDTDIVALSYYFLGQIYTMQQKEPEPEVALDYFLRAFCIWQRYDRPDGLQTIKTSIKNLYKRYEYENENPNFENWFDGKLEKVQETIKREKENEK